MSDDSIIASVLSRQVINALAKRGIHTVDQIKTNYPRGLLRVTGFGMGSIRAVEAAFFPERKYHPAYKSPIKPRRVSLISEELAKHLCEHPTRNYEDLK